MNVRAGLDNTYLFCDHQQPAQSQHRFYSPFNSLFFLLNDYFFFFLKMEAKVRKEEDFQSLNGFSSSTSSSSSLEDSSSFFSPSSVRRRRGIFVDNLVCRRSPCCFQNVAIFGFFILISLVFLIDSTSAQSKPSLSSLPTPKHAKSPKPNLNPTPTPTPSSSTNCSSGGEEGSSSNDCHDDDGDDDDGQPEEITDAIVLREVLKLTISIGLALLTVVGLGVMWPRWRSQVVSVSEVRQGGLGGKSFRLFDDEEGEQEDTEGTELDTIN